MTQEHKELLLRDLSARLPYGVKGIEANSICLLNTSAYSRSLIKNIEYRIERLGFKPYLFPLSSMTEEQEMEYDATFATILYEDGRRDSAMTYKSFDWLNKNHFDYRGLISMGLANDATGLNIY